MKRTKVFSLDEEVFEYLSNIDNASALVNSLVYGEIKKDIDRKKVKEVDMSNIHEAALNEVAEQTKKKEEQAQRNKSWELLDLDVREEIKSIESWGVKWREVFYPLYVQKGSLTVKDVRDWWFNEQARQRGKGTEAPTNQV